MIPLNDLVSHLVLGEQSSFGDLTVLPVLKTPYQPLEELIGLEEAIEAGAVQVTEVSEHGNVPELKVTNRCGKAIILLDGEELIGAKQNRIVNVTVIVAPFSTVVIPVSCVERGRWRWSSSHFTSADFASPGLRRLKFQQVSENQRQTGSLMGDQGTIWAEIEAKSLRMGVDSPTAAFRDLADTYRASDEDLSHHFPKLPGLIGYFAFIRGGFAGGDIFASPGLAARRFHKLLRSYHLDALDREASFPKLSPSALLEDVGRSAAEPFHSVGEGTEFRFTGDSAQGSIIFLGGALAHFTVLPRVDSKRHSFRNRFFID